jgi:Flp pilus assembly protein TadB
VSALSTLLAQAPFLDPGGAPDQVGGLRVSPRAFVAVLGAGLLIAIVGHVLQARALVAFGIALVFGATVLVPVLLALTN